jgi:hypothetical protein
MGRGASGGHQESGPLSAAADEPAGDVMRRRAAKCQAVGSGEQRPHRRGDRDNDSAVRYGGRARGFG